MRYPGQWPAEFKNASELQKGRQQAMDFVRDRGTRRRPKQPRDVIAQSGPRGILLTWNSPDVRVFFDIVGWRVYKNDENTLYHEIRDRGTRQMFVESTAATVSPTVNLFVSSINSLGVESVKVQAQGKSLNEASAPVMPAVPPGFTTGGSGGGNRNNTQGKITGFQ